MKVDLDTYYKSGDYERIRGKLSELVVGIPQLKSYSYKVTVSTEPVILRMSQGDGPRGA